MSAQAKVRLYSIFGGVPFYTSKIDDSLSLKDNILNLIVEDGATFQDEVSFFLQQEVRSVSTYGKILHAISNGATRLSEISTKSGQQNTGTTSKNMDLLLVLGIIEKEYCFGEQKNSKKTIYKMMDSLFHFYYTFIERHSSQKATMHPELFYDNIILPGLEEYSSFAFETLCRDFLKRKYAISIQDIGRYWYNDTKKKQNIEIDIVMKNTDRYYLYECKWINAPIERKVVHNLTQKNIQFSSSSFGFFSKVGYTDEVLLDMDDYYTVEDVNTI